MGTANLVVDTNIFIEHIRSKNKRNTNLYLIPDETNLFISAVTLYELSMGASTEEKKNDVSILTKHLTVLPFDENVAQQASTIYPYLKKTSQLIDFRDIFIAATCMEYGYPLKTQNIKHFNRIKGLQFA